MRILVAIIVISMVSAVTLPRIASAQSGAAPSTSSMPVPKKEIYRKPSKKKKKSVATAPQKSPEIVAPAPEPAPVKFTRPSAAPRMPILPPEPVAEIPAEPIEQPIQSAEPAVEPAAEPEPKIEQSGYAPNRINQGGIGAIGGLGKVGNPHNK